MLSWFLGDAQDDKHKYEKLKIMFLSAIFFCVIASYTVIKELKDSIFMALVGGKTYVPIAKLLIPLALIPAVLLYSKLVDNVRRYQVLAICALVYSVVGLVCALLVGHPTIGLLNTTPDKFRLFGWFYYFFVESYSAFVVSVFWAFLNSISSPDSAKKSYGMVTSASKVGGMVTAGFAWFLFEQNNCGLLHLNEVWLHQLLMIFSAVFLLAVPFLVWQMMKVVPGRFLHGYEAAYKFEKKQNKSGKDSTGMFSGLMMLLKYPYVFGIFSTVFFYEIVSAILSYMRLGVASDAAKNTSDVSCFLFKLVFFTHLVGFIISYFGTGSIMRKFGERLSLLMMPLVMGVLLFYVVFSHSPMSMVIAFVVLRAIYYGFDQPVREALYIPTVKDMKFKSKSWIDTFGKKMARSAGSTFNIFVSQCGFYVSQLLHAGFFGVLVGSWLIVSYLLGGRFVRAVKNNEVIGGDQEDI